MRRTIAIALLTAFLALSTVTAAFATDAMKPGHGHGDPRHVHYGAPGRAP